jgi:hypothetical protein
MKYEKLMERLESTLHTVSEALGQEVRLKFSGQRYAVAEGWANRDTIPQAEENGVYLYVSEDDEVWLIGKGQQRGGGGIGRRSCSHLGAYQRDKAVLFPYHDWRDDDVREVPGSVKASIASGAFSIATIAVTPDWYSSLVEVLAQTMVAAECGGEPPVLNRRIR